MATLKLIWLHNKGNDSKHFIILTLSSPYHNKSNMIIAHIDINMKIIIIINAMNILYNKNAFQNSKRKLTTYHP
jgi:hypothetical protein